MGENLFTSIPLIISYFLPYNWVNFTTSKFSFSLTVDPSGLPPTNRVASPRLTRTVRFEIYNLQVTSHSHPPSQAQVGAASSARPATPSRQHQRPVARLRLRLRPLVVVGFLPRWWGCISTSSTTTPSPP
jgi:hypothetical protein